MQRTARGLDYRVRFVVPDLQPVDELQPTSCTWKCLAAEALGGHSAGAVVAVVASPAHRQGERKRNASWICGWAWGTHQMGIHLIARCVSP